MSSPTRPARRRQRSARVLVASTLLVIATLAVIGTVAAGSWPLLVGAASLAVLLGVAATRITYTELADSRREAATDRAEQAQAYRALTSVRVAEHAEFVAESQGRIAKHAATIGRLEGHLRDARTEAEEAQRLLAAEQDRLLGVQDVNRRLTTRLDDAEQRAAEAVVRVAELEHDVDVLTSQWHAERGVWEAQTLRKHG